MRKTSLADKYPASATPAEAVQRLQEERDHLIESLQARRAQAAEELANLNEALRLLLGQTHQPRRGSIRNAIVDLFRRSGPDASLTISQVTHALYGDSPSHSNRVYVSMLLGSAPFQRVDRGCYRLADPDPQPEETRGQRRSR